MLNLYDEKITVVRNCHDYLKDLQELGRLDLPSTVDSLKSLTSVWSEFRKESKAYQSYDEIVELRQQLQDITKYLTALSLDHTSTGATADSSRPTPAPPQPRTKIDYPVFFWRYFGLGRLLESLQYSH